MTDISNSENYEFNYDSEDSPRYEEPSRPVVYSPTPPPSSSRQDLYFKVGGIGILIWGIALLLYEAYQWWVFELGPLPGLTFIEGLALISLVIGMGATLASVAGLGYQKTLYQSQLPRYAFLLTLFLGWLFFISDILDLLVPGLGSLLWSIAYVVTGVLLIIWSRLMSQLAAFRPNDFAKYAGYILIIGGIVYLAAPLIFIYLTMFIAPLGLALAAFATLGMDLSRRHESKEPDYERELL